MHQDDFYILSNRNSLKKLLLEANEKSYKSYVDKLDCKVSFHRKRTEIDVIDFLKLIQRPYSKIFYVFIHRTYLKDNLEVGIVLYHNRISFHLYIFLETKYLSYFIEKYNLRLKWMRE